MKYMLLINVTEQDMGEPAPGVMDQHLAVTEAAIKRGAYVTCDGLEPTATAVRVQVRDGKVLRHDGPFAETREIVGGYYIVDCHDLDEAVEFASMIPMPPHGWVEVRRVAEIPGWDDAVAEIRSRVDARASARG